MGTLTKMEIIEIEFTDIWNLNGHVKKEKIAKADIISIVKNPNTLYLTLYYFAEE